MFLECEASLQSMYMVVSSVQTHVAFHCSTDDSKARCVVELFISLCDGRRPPHPTLKDFV